MKNISGLRYFHGKREKDSFEFVFYLFIYSILTSSTGVGTFYSNGYQCKNKRNSVSGLCTELKKIVNLLTDTFPEFGWWSVILSLPRP